MDYQELFHEENMLVMERYDLAMERIAGIRQELEASNDTVVSESARDYFRNVADFAMQIEELARLQMRDELESWTLSQLQKLNHDLYADILPDHYEISYANPSFAARLLGEEIGPMLSAFYAQFRSAIVFAYECRLTDITILCETFIEIYNMFEGEIPSAKSIRDVLYWFHSDYTDVTLTYRIREQLDPSLTFAKDIIMKSDLSDLRYLYRFGEYISDAELQIASLLNTLPEETICKMASAYTEG